MIMTIGLMESLLVCGEYDNLPIHGQLKSLPTLMMCTSAITLPAGYVSASACACGACASPVPAVLRQRIAAAYRLGQSGGCTLRRERADSLVPACASADSFYAAQCCGAIIVMMPCVQRAMTQPVLALLTVARVPGVAMIYVYTREKDAGVGHSVRRQPLPASL